MNLGYLKVATFTPEIKVGDVEFNVNSIKKGIITLLIMPLLIYINRLLYLPSSLGSS